MDGGIENDIECQRRIRICFRIRLALSEDLVLND